MIRTTQPSNAIDLLNGDHKALRKLFKAYRALVERGAEPAQKEELAREICLELSIHPRIEEEIFYPAVRLKLDDDGLINEAVVEHATATDLIGQIECMSPEDDLYDAKVIVLGGYVDHHVKEEKNEIFPRARRSLDIDELGDALAQRKQALRANAGAGDPAGRAKKLDGNPNATLRDSR